MAEPESMILPLLREMRAEINEEFAQINRRFDDLTGEIRDNSKRIENVKGLALAESVLGRYAALEVEDRLEEIEKRLAALEGH